MPTLNEVRSRVETDLDDATLQRIIDAETQYLTRRAGGITETETHRAFGLREIVLRRPPASITSIKERRSITGEQVTLAGNDWRQVGNYNLLRLTGGSNSANFWGQEIVVEYKPEIDEDLRERVLLDLVQLSVEFRGIESESIGDYERRETQRG